jgi:type II secretory pathway component PulF
MMTTDFITGLAWMNVTWWGVVLFVVLWILVQLFPAVAFYVVVYLLFSLPLRRKERARVFLDLLQLILKQGRVVEPTLISLSNTRDPMMGVRFHELAVHLQNGLPLDRALEEAPRLLPPRVRAMLQAGLKIGAPERVIPACQQVLGDAATQTRSALNYLVVIAFVITPLTAMAPLFLMIVVLPRLIETFEGLVPGMAPPPILVFLVAAQPWILMFTLTTVVGLWCAALCYLGGPRLTVWVQKAGPRIFDRLQLWVPWQRKRLHRDFSSVLAILLDSGLTEAEALELAGESTANLVFMRRVRAAVSRLRDGHALADVLSDLEGSGEFRWRLTNAAYGNRGFRASLEGWHEALAAKATQQEQAVSQAMTTGLVLLNGILVGLLFLGVFGGLIGVIEGTVPW